MNENYKKRTWVDTINYDGLTYNDYEEYCEEEGWEAGSDTSEEYYEWLNDETNRNREDFFENLKWSKKVNDVPCYVGGHLGLWWGKPEIKGKRFETLIDALNSIFPCSDYLDITIESDTDGVVTAMGHHHDGTDIFEIRPLNEKGIKKTDEDEDATITENELGKYPLYLY